LAMDLLDELAEKMAWRLEVRAMLARLHASW
jgi:hypothetical protein